MRSDRVPDFRLGRALDPSGMLDPVARGGRGGDELCRLKKVLKRLAGDIGLVGNEETLPSSTTLNCVFMCHVSGSLGLPGAPIGP
mmetsp:Transcript_31636/g.53154  ORF Transcript_31636/g.53154 Transcript_31636/m.53154 type:complete len:85 (+) Transcript_31636:1981-2235(+)